MISLISGEGNGNPFQSSCLENSMDGGVWWAATVNVVIKSRTWLSYFAFTSLIRLVHNGLLISRLLLPFKCWLTVYKVNRGSPKKCMHVHAHTPARTHTHTCIYIYMCVCVCVSIYMWIFLIGIGSHSYRNWQVPWSGMSTSKRISKAGGVTQSRSHGLRIGESVV